MFLVTYKIKGGCGDTEYHEYSWFEVGTQSDYDAGVIKDKVLIQEVYGAGHDDELFEDNYDDDTNTYENYNNDWVSVYSVNDITPKELDVLDKFGVAYK